MPLLGFFKRDRSKSSGANSLNTSRTSVVTADDDADHVDADYVLPPIDEVLPTFINGNTSQASFASASSSRIKLPFRNRHANGTATPNSSSFDSSNTSFDYSTARSSVDVSSVSSTITPLARPSLSDIFPSRHEASTPPTSARSLPITQSQRRPEPSPLQKETASAIASKPSSGGLFSWARERKKSRPSKPKLEDSAPESSASSSPTGTFNLVSFRHVQSDLSLSPSGQKAAQQAAQSPPNAFVSPTPRPRGGSMASDTSQRISVAAFREAQARRSSSNLNSQPPSPSIRPVSLVDPSNSMTDLVRPRPPRAARPAASPGRQQRSQSTSSVAVSSSDDEQSSSEEDSESGDQSSSRSRSRVSRQRTITKHTYSRARSDLGHGSSSDYVLSDRYSHHQQSTSSRSELGHGSPGPRVASPFRTGPPPSSFQKSSSGAVGTRSHSLYKRERGSYSTSELAPSAAAARSSTAAAANLKDSMAKSRQSTAVGSDSSDSDSSEESSDDDNAPLSTLMNPKRPGSALSHASRGGQQQQRKPLIDLGIKHNPVNGKPVDEATVGNEDGDHAKKKSLRPLLISPTDINNRLTRLTEEAGLGNYSKCAASKSEDNFGRGSITASPLPMSEQPSPSIPSPPVQKSPRLDQDTQKPMKNDRKASLVSSTSSSSFASLSTSSPTIADHEARKSQDEKPLRPIPIKERNEHHGGFIVVSRPQKAHSPNSPSSNPQSPSDTVLPQQSSQHHKGVPANWSPNSSSPRDNAHTTTTKYPPRSSSFMVTSRPLSGGASDVQLSAQAPAPPKSMSGPGGVSASRSQTQTSPSTRPSTQLKRRESPASSTGGSSNGKAPLTPMDGSDYFSPDVRGGNGSSPSGSSIGPPSAMKGGRGHVKRGSVTFQEPEDLSSTIERGRKSSFPSKKGEELSLQEVEARRKERRRGEAKAAIELGNVINGPGPKLDDDDDATDESGVGNMGPRMSMYNQMMNPSLGMGLNFAAPQMNMGWQQHLQVPQAGSMMLSPQQFMIPPPQMNDPAFLAAHQQAMMIAKQAYQMAVAQQAMAAAADEWERSSNVGGYAPSAISSSGMGFGMGMGGWPNAGGSMFPPGPRSMYAGSDFGGPSSQAGWASASVYGEAFGPSVTPSPRRTRAMNGVPSGVAQRDSVAFPSTFQRSESAGNLVEKQGMARPQRPNARPRTNTAPSKAPLPSQHRNSSAIPDRLVPPVPTFGASRKPPSSWKVAS